MADFPILQTRLNKLSTSINIRSSERLNTNPKDFEANEIRSLFSERDRSDKDDDAAIVELGRTRIRRNRAERTQSESRRPALFSGTFEDYGGAGAIQNETGEEVGHFYGLSAGGFTFDFEKDGVKYFGDLIDSKKALIYDENYEHSYIADISFDKNNFHISSELRERKSGVGGEPILSGKLKEISDQVETVDLGDYQLDVYDRKSFVAFKDNGDHTRTFLGRGMFDSEGNAYLLVEQGEAFQFNLKIEDDILSISDPTVIDADRSQVASFGSVVPNLDGINQQNTISDQEDSSTVPNKNLNYLNGSSSLESENDSVASNAKADFLKRLVAQLYANVEAMASDQDVNAG